MVLVLWFFCWVPINRAICVINYINTCNIVNSEVFLDLLIERTIHFAAMTHKGAKWVYKGKKEDATSLSFELRATL